jgi:hypothetical protein
MSPRLIELAGKGAAATVQIDLIPLTTPRLEARTHVLSPRREISLLPKWRSYVPPAAVLRAGHRRHDRESPVPSGMMCGGGPKRKFFLMELFRPLSVRILAFQRTR